MNGIALTVLTIAALAIRCQRETGITVTDEAAVCVNADLGTAAGSRGTLVGIWVSRRASRAW